jgi:SAM-dependent methyltransferase
MINRCNVCGFIVVRIHKGVFGLRCLRCRSTFIHRATVTVLKELDLAPDAAVYELSSHGAIFNYLSKRFSNLTFSEYFDDVEPGTKRNGVTCQDVQNLTYPDSSFDLVTSTEVFEHVPDDSRGFREVYRILKPGGIFVFTVPMEGNEVTIQRAAFKNGELVHMLSPEYHGDRLRSKGVLAFRNYGLDIDKKLLDAGFATVDIREISSKKYAIIPKRVVKATKPK